MTLFGELFNPFELHGAESVTFFFLLSTTCVVASFLARRWFELAGWFDQPGHNPADLTPYEIAYLAGGSVRVQEVVLLTLLEQGLLEAQPDKLLASTSSREGSRDPIEQAVLEKVRHNPRSIDAVKLSMASPIHYLADRLREREYLFSDSQKVKIKAIAVGINFLALFAVAIKINIGISTGYPVGFLVMIAAVDMLFCIVQLLVPIAPTPKGNHAVREAKSALRSAAMSHRLQNRNLPMDAALFASLAATAQAADLVGTSYITNRQLIAPPPSSSDGGSGCGGGGGCGGGCGGGGCGG